MPVITLHHTNRAEVYARLNDDSWCIACLCAAWCNTCESFRSAFEALATRHPDKLMLWIDIEDEAEIIGDFDVTNFPTLLIQCGAEVTFLGAIEPNAAVAHRLVEAQTKAWHSVNHDCIGHENNRDHPTSSLNLRSNLGALLSI